MRSSIEVINESGYAVDATRLQEAAQVEAFMLFGSLWILFLNLLVP